jgi:hypothetical protein
MLMGVNGGGNEERKSRDKQHPMMIAAGRAFYLEVGRSSTVTRKVKKNRNVAQ